MPSRVKICQRQELEDLHTGSLLSRLRSLQQCEQSFSLSDRFGVEEEPDPDATGYIEFKETEAWQKAYRELKDVLSRRKHFPRASERHQKRKMH